MLTIEGYLTQHTKLEDVSEEIKEAAEELIPKVNLLLADPDCPYHNPGQRSGLRPAAFNAKVPNAASNSTHMSGHGVDVNDLDNSIDEWLTDEILERYGLYREHPDYTSTWVHLQDVPPHSGHRTYIP